MRQERTCVLWTHASHEKVEQFHCSLPLTFRHFHTHTNKKKKRNLSHRVNSCTWFFFNFFLWSSCLSSAIFLLLCPQYIRNIRMSMNAVMYYGGDVRLWFSQLESVFAFNGIQAEDKRLHILFFLMPFSLASIIKDLRNESPADASYVSVKEELLKRTSQSAENRFCTLVNDESLNGRTPSQFLRSMRELSGGEVIDGWIFHQIFVSRLPYHVQDILVRMSKSMPL